MVPVVAELAPLCRSPREKTSVWRARKQQSEGVINDSHPAAALEETGGGENEGNDPFGRYFARLPVLAAQLSSLEIAPCARIGNGHLSQREHALSRAAAYEKAPRRNN